MYLSLSLYIWMHVEMDIHMRMLIQVHMQIQNPPVNDAVGRMEFVIVRSAGSEIK